jgi:hypothetical protein
MVFAPILDVHHGIILAALDIGNEQNIGGGRGSGQGRRGERGRNAMTLEIYKPRAKRNNKQLNKTLTETVHCPPASSELKQCTCQWNTTHFYKNI